MAGMAGTADVAGVADVAGTADVSGMASTADVTGMAGNLCLQGEAGIAGVSSYAQRPNLYLWLLSTQGKMRRVPSKHGPSFLFICLPACECSHTTSVSLDEFLQLLICNCSMNCMWLP